VSRYKYCQFQTEVFFFDYVCVCAEGAEADGTESSHKLMSGDKASDDESSGSNDTVAFNTDLLCSHGLYLLTYSVVFSYIYLFVEVKRGCSR
jgi:hypothetical protein